MAEPYRVKRLAGTALHLYELLWGWQCASRAKEIPFAFPTYADMEARLARAGIGIKDRMIRYHIQRFAELRLIRIVRSCDPEVCATFDALIADGVIEPSSGAVNVYFVDVDPRRLDEHFPETGPTPRKLRRARRRRRPRPARTDQPELFTGSALPVSVGSALPVSVGSALPVSVGSALPVLAPAPLESNSNSEFKGGIQSADTPPVAALVDLFVSESLTGPETTAKTRSAVERHIGDLVRQGVPPHAIRAEILRPARDRDEPVWALRKRLLPRQREPTPGRLSPEEIARLALEPLERP